MTEAPSFYSTRVAAEWLDEYGHMNMAVYVQVCDQATYAFWEHANDGAPLAERGGAEYAVVETHVNYLRELRLDDPLRITTQLLGADDKRMHLFHTLQHAGGGHVAATNEVMALGFNLDSRALAPFTEPVRTRLRKLLAEHRSLALPRNAGRAIAMAR